jgi:apolipoprotein N-acyltransferase
VGSNGPDGRRVDLLVLPEGFAMVGVEGLDGAHLVARARAASIEQGMSVLLGAYVDEGGATPENLAVLMHPDGSGPAPYGKRRLVPLVEWRPGDRGRPDRSGRDRDGALVLRDGERVLGPLVCWEAIFPEAARDARLAGADILVNVSNDAWFGESGGLGRAGREQHAAHLVMRAVEHRMGAVRSGNGGASYVVAPSGRVDARREAEEETRVTTDVVRSTSIVTLYTRTGDLVGLGSVLLLLGLGSLPSRPRRPGLGGGGGLTGPSGPVAVTFPVYTGTGRKSDPEARPRARSPGPAPLDVWSRT